MVMDLDGFEDGDILVVGGHTKDIRCASYDALLFQKREVKKAVRSCGGERHGRLRGLRRPLLVLRLICRKQPLQ